MAGRGSMWFTNVKPRLFEIRGWCRDGYTDIQMCEALGISTTTFCKYKHQHPSLVQALKINKEIADLTIENSLFKRARGYSYMEVTTKTKRDADGNVMHTTTDTVEKEYPPETKAIERWLMNRQPKKWRNTNNIVISGDKDAPLNLGMESIEDAMKRRGIPIPILAVGDLPDES